MTLSGVKKEEYREIKPFWIRRLKWKTQAIDKFDVTRLMNGMAKNAPVFTIEHKGIRIGEGRPEWGAEPGKKYFIIMHGEVLETKNINQNT
jgi:hypothetical protein